MDRSRSKQDDIALGVSFDFSRFYLGRFVRGVFRHSVSRSRKVTRRFQSYRLLELCCLLGF